MQRTSSKWMRRLLGSICMVLFGAYWVICWNFFVGGFVAIGIGLGLAIFNWTMLRASRGRNAENISSERPGEWQRLISVLAYTLISLLILQLLAAIVIYIIFGSH